jgi:threonine aldolase
MRRAMYEAEVGDDTYDGDPTVIRLQELAAQKTGKEASLFVVSGTMGNLLGVLVVDLFLSHLETFLHGLEIGRAGVSFVVEHSGLLVASSVDEPVFIPAEGKEPARRLDAYGSGGGGASGLSGAAAGGQ